MRKLPEEQQYTREEWNVKKLLLTKLQSAAVDQWIPFKQVE
jgi:hypothetical protein